MHPGEPLLCAGTSRSFARRVMPKNVEVWDLPNLITPTQSLRYDFKAIQVPIDCERQSSEIGPKVHQGSLFFRSACLGTGKTVLEPDYLRMRPTH